MPDPSRLYGYHVENLRSVDRGITQVRALLKRAVERDERNAVGSLVRVNALLLAARLEVRLRKLLHEPGVDHHVRTTVEQQANIEAEWLKLIELAFRRHYALPTGSIAALVEPTRSRHSTLRSAVTNDLRPMIAMRNRLAHGQWAFALNSNSSAINSAVTQQIAAENYLSLGLKERLSESLCNCIHDLVISLPTFERDFRDNYMLIENTRRELRTRRLARWDVIQRARFLRRPTR
jgi:hypothetical protein